MLWLLSGLAAFALAIFGGALALFTGPRRAGEDAEIDALTGESADEEAPTPEELLAQGKIDVEDYEAMVNDDRLQIRNM